MLESKKGKVPESKKKTKEINLYFWQGDKPAIIFNKAGNKVLAKAIKGVFTVKTLKIATLLKRKGYEEASNE